MEWERVAAVAGVGGPGSGYVIGPRLVLSSAHVVGAVGASVTVFRPGRTGQFAGQVVWCGTSAGRDDAALVQIDDPQWTPLPGGVVVFGRSVTHRPGIACECWGAPNLVQRPRKPVEVSQQAGTLNAGDRMVGDRYVMNLTAHPPEGSSPWGGLSGAALFCGDLLVGVIAMDPAGRRHAALEAVPAYVLVRDPGFTAVVTAHVGLSGVRCEAIELRELVDAQSRSQPQAAFGSPAGLLPARRAVVPFRGREKPLAELHEWAGAAGVLRLVHGPGGQGKTRLAYEFAEQLAERDWAVVWLDPACRAEELTVLADTVTPLLIVIDYAETRTGQLVALLETLTRRRHSSPVKVLLLARTAGGWWDQLAATNDVVRDAMDTAQVQVLPVLDDTASARAETYQAAVDAFAAALNRVPGLQDTPWATPASVLSARPPQMSDQRRTVLAVQMGALADLLDTAHPSSSTEAAGAGGGSRGPEDRVLDHERRYWQSTAQSQGLNLTSATLIDVVAATVLLGPTTPEEVGDVLTRVPGMADQPTDRHEAVRGWLMHLYPAGEQGTFEGLQPDRLAERLIGRLTLDHSRANVVDVLAPTVQPLEATRLLTVCTRAAAHAVFGESVSQAVTRWCTRHAETLLVPAIQVATQVEAPGPLVQAIDQAVGDITADADVLAELERALPRQSQVLAETAVILGRTLVARHRAVLAQDPSSDPSDLALSLNSLAVRLGALGCREEGLEVVNEAVDIRRRLAKQQPETFLPDLASSLNNLSNRLGALGRREEGLAAISEAVEVYRRLAEQRPETFLPDLTISLNNLSGRLGALGRWEEGLEVINEAVDIRRQLAKQWPEAFLVNLASSLNNLAIQLGALGRRKEGLAAISEAVEVYRRLAEQRPDAFVPYLAISLNNLAVDLGELGRREEGLAAIGEAVEVYRRLAEQRPEAFLPDLAMSLNNLAIRLGALGRREEGLAAISEAVEVCRRLAEQRPTVHDDDLNRCLRVLAWLQGNQSAT
ncbi:tetratricopeptide repeat protein [Lentzea sp. HUAS12]|uniref:tetratricopeptide repeat protein n=1 Tax=Lentzea sp. HUAS12 TaxID=2951806 RepID=UPI0020A179A6|nr:tetratricopeptide repeat protein [Lentzea sp. HUAS12]USX50615.1 tetratricopeptide repeat protein [Lentzea sp. HUAS12]